MLPGLLARNLGPQWISEDGTVLSLWSLAVGPDGTLVSMRIRLRADFQIGPTSTRRVVPSLTLYKAMTRNFPGSDVVSIARSQP